ncbi:MAG: archease [candidate division WOR-3 bacterium]|nr:MAG: archease [candidate division WOR-3 bacterium]
MTVLYQYTDHTADLGIETWGRSLDELFANIGRAIFETQLTGSVNADKEKSIDLRSESLEDLFIDWCRELLYNFSVHGFIPSEYTISVRETSLQAVLRGDKFDPTRHRVKLEIKNPTYHDLSIVKEKHEFRAKIIFDV